MIAEKIKQIRNQKGFSQEKLAEKSNLSLRTIQRIENGKSDPRGNTIIQIADALDVSIDTFLDNQKEENRSYLASLHISAMSFIVFPLLGIILPLLLWISKKGKIKDLTSNAKKLLSFQITWTLLLFIGLGVYFIWWNYKIRTLYIMPTVASDIYLPLYFFIAGLYLYNLIIVSYNILRVGSGKNVWYKPSINFLP
ncbi:MAG: helix-turn-helix domain-containing protein [Bacteroidota bacterium]